jgi:hypothetical protein
MFVLSRLRLAPRGYGGQAGRNSRRGWRQAALGHRERWPGTVPFRGCEPADDGNARTTEAAVGARPSWAFVGAFAGRRKPAKADGSRHLKKSRPAGKGDERRRMPEKAEK